MILTNSGVLKLMQRIKSFITSQLNTKAASVHTHSISEINDLASQLGGGGYTKSESDDKFVDKTSNQTIDGAKTFTNRLTYKATRTIAGDGTSGNFAGSVNFTDKNDVQIGTFALSVFNNYGYTEHVLNIINPLWFNDNTKTKNFAVRLRVKHETEEVSFTPTAGNIIDLGSTTFKWKTINGVNPSDLSLPSDTYITIDTTSFAWGNNFTFTPSVNGHLFISIADSTGIRRLSLKTGRGEYYFSNQTGILRFTMPVYKDKLVTILAVSSITETVVPSLSLFPLQGNV